MLNKFLTVSFTAKEIERTLEMLLSKISNHHHMSHSITIWDTTILLEAQRSIKRGKLGKECDRAEMGP
jgi:hypothetical protein